ncbi:MAG: hypothetical protein ACKVZJ_04830 [Phycisphaerales bacterium]
MVGSPDVPAGRSIDSVVEAAVRGVERVDHMVRERHADKHTIGVVAGVT